MYADILDNLRGRDITHAISDDYACECQDRPLHSSCGGSWSNCVKPLSNLKALATFSYNDDG